MELEFKDYDRKPFSVRAVEVTYKNIEQIAELTNGTMDTKTTRLIGAETELPIVRIQGQGDDKGKEFVAELGCFVVELRGRFRVYKPAQFRAVFEEHQELVPQPEIVETSLVEKEQAMEGCEVHHDNSSVDGQETVAVHL